MRKLILGTLTAIATALPALAGAEGDGPRFLDRELLTDTLTLDEQAELPGAQEELAVASAERDAAAVAVVEAEADLLKAQVELKEAEDALAMDPTDPDLQAEVDKAMAQVLAADDALGDAKDDLGAKQGVVDEKTAVVDGIENEIAATEDLVGELSDKQVQAFNNALHSSHKRGLLPYDFDSDLLQRAIDEGLGTGSIHHMVGAFRMRAQFEMLALRFEGKADASGKEMFLAKADRASMKGAAEFDKFMAKVDAASARAEAKAALKEAVAHEQRASARGLEKGNGHSK